jgi:hypothetical protein
MDSIRLYTGGTMFGETIVEQTERVIRTTEAKKTTCGVLFGTDTPPDYSELCGRQAVTFCAYCGVDLCEKCRVIFATEIYCEPCGAYAEKTAAYPL